MSVLRVPAVVAFLVAMMLTMIPTVDASVSYTAPGLTDTLASSSQSYLIGVISFILFSVCIALAVGSLTGIDYSGDSLLTVDVEPSTVIDE